MSLFIPFWRAVKARIACIFITFCSPFIKAKTGGNNKWVVIHYKFDVFALYLTGQSDTETVLSAWFALDTGNIDSWKDANIADLPQGMYKIRLHLENAEAFAITLKKKVSR